MRKFILSLFATFFIVACGGTTVKVKQSSDGVNATISVETNNPTNVDVTPSVSVRLDDLSKVLDVVHDSLSFDSNGEMILGPDVVRASNLSEVFDVIYDSVSFDINGETVSGASAVRQFLNYYR